MTDTTGVATAGQLDVDDHHPIIRSQKLRGARISGTALACTCGWDKGIVTNEAISKGGRAIAREAHARHVDATVASR